MLGTTKEVADIVTKATIPLLPAIAHKTAHLVEPRCTPRPTDALGGDKPLSGFDGPKYRRGSQHSGVRIAREDGGEIKPETIHVHLLNPVAEAIDNEPTDHRMIGVNRLAGTAEIGISRAIGFE